MAIIIIVDIRTEIVVMATAGDNKTEELRLGPYVPAWKSRQVRIGSWLLVAAFSTLGAALATGFDIQHSSKYFLGILLARWLLSALLGRAVAGYTEQVSGARRQVSGTERQSTVNSLQSTVKGS